MASECRDSGTRLLRHYNQFQCHRPRVFWGIDLLGAHGRTLSANTFVIVHKYGLRIGPDSDRITITGNSFANNYMGNGKTKRQIETENFNQKDVGTSIVLDNTSSINITGNSFSGMTENAVIGLGQCRPTIISSNLVTNIHTLSTKNCRPSTWAALTTLIWLNTISCSDGLL